MRTANTGEKLASNEDADRDLFPSLGQGGEKFRRWSSPLLISLSEEIYDESSVEMDQSFAARAGLWECERI